MRLLVLGGGGFLGHHVVTAAVSAGHEVTTFSREASGRDGVRELTGDRRGDLSALEARVRDGERWDGVLDTFSGTDAVRASARLLAGAVGTYGYVSGMSVYAPDGPAVPDEAAPVRRPGAYDDRLQERSVAKLACEAAVREETDGRAFVPRVGILVGPRDPTDRFTWWPVRMARALAGDAPRQVPAPGDLARPVQWSDARDVAAWVVDSLALGRTGTWNTVGPGRDEALSSVLSACLRAAGGTPGDVELRPVDEAVLRDALRGVDEEERPLWFPEDQIPQAAVDSSAALGQGLAFRPAEETARDTVVWRREQGGVEQLLAGLDPGLEAALLAG